MYQQVAHAALGGAWFYSVFEALSNKASGVAGGCLHVEISKNMTVRFFITIDTEEDEWGDYRSYDYSVRNVIELLRVQEIFNRYGAVPTYLVTYPVVKNNQSRGILLDLLSKNRCEIGTHCHPWNTPPFKEEINEQHSMLCNLPYLLVLNKIEILHQEIKESLGVIPRCFRAGRWGFSPNVAKAIQSMGYQVDTSVTPFVDWDVYMGPDYRKAPRHIYRFNPDALLSIKQDGGLLEVPTTIGFLQRNFDFCHRLTEWMSGDMARHLHLRGILDRARFLNFRWLSPELSNGSDMVALAKTCLRRGCSHLNMSFHSTTLLPGKTPFVRTQEDLNSFLRDIEQVIKFAAANGLVFSALSDILEDHPMGTS